MTEPLVFLQTFYSTLSEENIIFFQKEPIIGKKKRPTMTLRSIFRSFFCIINIKKNYMVKQWTGVKKNFNGLANFFKNKTVQKA